MECCHVWTGPHNSLLDMLETNEHVQAYVCPNLAAFVVFYIVSILPQLNTGIFCIKNTFFWTMT